MAKEIERVRQVFDSGLSLCQLFCKQSVEFKDSPPPAKFFWLTENYPLAVEGAEPIVVRLELEQPRRLFTLSVPGNPQNKYPEIMVSFGFGYGPQVIFYAD